MSPEVIENKIDQVEYALDGVIDKIRRIEHMLEEFERDRKLLEEEPTNELSEV